MNIRRIEAGILNAGSDFNQTTTPYDVGFDRFVDEDKADFIGKEALAKAPRGRRSYGLRCAGGEPLISGAIEVGGQSAGIVTAGAISPYLGHGIGLGLMPSAEHGPGTPVTMRCRDGSMQAGEIVSLPMYDELAEIPRGKRVDIPIRAETRQ